MATRRWIRLFAIALAFGTGACYQEYAENFADEEIITQDAAIGEQEADDALDVVYQAEVVQRLHPGVTITVNNCATITTDTINHIMTIDFGSQSKGCQAFFGRYRHGKIQSIYEGDLGDTLARRTIGFQNYWASHQAVEGTVILDSMYLDAANQVVASRSLQDFKVTFSDGSAVTFNGSRRKVWIAGMGDTLEYNNAYTLSGTITGTSSSGHAFRQDITTGVFINFYCASSTGGFARTFGVVELSKLDGYPDRTRTVDYGDSTCNKTVSVITFRRTYGISAN